MVTPLFKKLYQAFMEISLCVIAEDIQDIVGPLTSINLSGVLTFIPWLLNSLDLPSCGNNRAKVTY